MSGPELITSATNPVIKTLRRLGDRKGRRVEAASVVWGIQPVLQAAEAGHPIRRRVVAPGLLRAEAAQRFVAEAEAAGTMITRLSDELFTRVADRDHPTGLAAVIDIVEVDLADLALPDGPATLLALEGIGNPGNLGSVLRSAEAAGAVGVVLVGATADPWDPAAIKASMGAVFTTPVARVAAPDGLIGWAHRHGWSVATTAARGDHPLWRTDLPDRLIVLLGSEQQGLSDRTLAAGDLRISIPMRGTTESLNLAAAATVLLYEAWRPRDQRHS